jgi:hypothetical protein
VVAFLLRFILEQNISKLSLKGKMLSSINESNIDPDKLVSALKKGVYLFFSINSSSFSFYCSHQEPFLIFNL